MIGLFKQKTPVNILVLFVLGILIKLPIFRRPVTFIADEEGAFFYKKTVAFLNSHAANFHWLIPLIIYFLLFIQALLLNRIMNEYRMTSRSSYLPAASYLIISSLLPEWNQFSSTLILNTFILLIFNSLFALYNQQQAKASVFNIGLFLGLSSFFFFPSLILFIWIFFGLLVMRPVRLNEWLVCILGVTAPYYFYAAYLLFTNQWSWDHLINPLSVKLPVLNQSAWLALAGLLLIIPFLSGAYFVQDNLRRMLIQVRKNWSLFLIFLLFALFIPFLDKGSKSIENWILVIIPIAAFHTCAYLYPVRRLIPTIIFWLSIIFILAYQYTGQGW